MTDNHQSHQINTSKIDAQTVDKIINLHDTKKEFLQYLVKFGNQFERLMASFIIEAATASNCGVEQ